MIKSVAVDNHQDVNMKKDACESLVSLQHFMWARNGLEGAIALGRVHPSALVSRAMAECYPNATFYQGWCEKRQQDFLAGRLCAASAQQRCINQSFIFHQLRPSDISRSLCGKPIWHNKHYGSISHSGELAIAAVFHAEYEVQVGIDLEFKVGHRQAQGLARYILSPQERECIEASGLNFSLAVTLLFSAKESLFKALSEPEDKLDFGLARLIDIDTQNHQLHFVRHGHASDKPGDALNVDFRFFPHVSPSGVRLAVVTLFVAPKS